MEAAQKMNERCNQWACPKCGAKGCPRVGDYAARREFIRYRRCRSCEYGFSTRQPLDVVTNRTVGREELCNETRVPPTSTAQPPPRE